MTHENRIIFLTVDPELMIIHHYIHECIHIWTTCNCLFLDQKVIEQVICVDNQNLLYQLNKAEKWV